MSDDAADVEVAHDDATVVIGAGARFDGLLSFWGKVRVEGRMRGEVAAEGILEVGPDASLDARIAVDVLVVEGLVEGDVVARERVEIRASGRITASVATPRLLLAEGGSLEGQLVMTARPAAANPAGAPAATAA